MKVKTVDERIEQFKTVHGDRYDYSLLTNPIKWDSKIPVICSKHGVFETIVNNHQRGAGCPVCAGVKLLSREEKINRAVAIHGDKYDYSLWPNTFTMSDKVVTICPIHGAWSHAVANHINRKCGCPACANNLPRTFDKFVRQARAIHGDKYSYVHQDDVRNNTDVTIICDVHGEFQQSVSNHLSGKGCNACAITGFNTSKPGTVYMLQANDCFKVGITNKWEQRLKQLRNETPFNFTVISVLNFDNGGDAKAVETFMLKFHESAGLSGFSGATEWRKGTPKINLTKGA